MGKSLDWQEGGLLYYYAIDGDDVGRRLEALVLANDIASVRAYSLIVEAAIQQMRDRLLSCGCLIVFCAGDSILAEAPMLLPEEVTPTIAEGISFSIGIGASCADALLALKRAKGLGRGRVECLRTV
jgi:GTP cyclohydrolase III